MCGQHVPAGASSCKECGACPHTGWSDDTRYDGLDLPETTEEIQKPRTSHFSVPGNESSKSSGGIAIVVVVLLVAVFLWMMFRF